ncbi:MAG: DUF2281 domain-containing protein [Bacteroidia bacterium]|nr:DUF2281 domain-containing protein [Bacteroidia bacterium]
MYKWTNLINNHKITEIMESIALYTRINSLPENLRDEANDFIDFLLSKKSPKKKKKMRKAGFLRGKIKIDPTFKEPLNDFKEYMP